MYKIKQLPEDFLVREMSMLKVGEGPYIYFELFKRSQNTIEAIDKIAKALNVRNKDIGFAGMKDRNAVTWQLCSVKNITKEKLESVKLANLELTYVGKGAEPINLGDLDGNEFEIIVRDIEQDFDVKDSVPNYFGEQRFSSNNYDIGKSLIKKDFKKATELIDQKCVKDFLEKTPTNFVDAINTLPSRLIKIYINSVQSYLWNRCVSEIVKKYKHCESEDKWGANNFPTEKLENRTIPLVSFENEYEDKEVEEIYNKILEDENIHERDFIIRELPGITPEGANRDLLMDISELEVYDADDELNKGKKKLKVNFRLGKGSYATVFIRSLFS